MVQNTTLIQLTVRCRQHMVLAHRYIAHVAGQRVFPFFFFAWEGAYEVKELSSTYNLFYYMRRYYVSVQYKLILEITFGCETSNAINKGLLYQPSVRNIRICLQDKML